MVNPLAVVKPSVPLVVLIMASGPDRKGWTIENPKHTANINGEPLMLRTIRQLRGRGHDPIVMTDKPAVRKLLPDAELPQDTSNCARSLLSTRPYWQIRTVVLAGDTVFSGATLDMIFADDEPLSVVGSSDEIFAIIFNESEQQRVVTAARDAAVRIEAGAQNHLWTFYRILCNFDNVTKHRLDDVIYRKIPKSDYTDDIDSQGKYKAVLAKLG